MKVFIENNSIYQNEVKYIFSLFAFNKEIPVEYVDSISNSDISVGEFDKNNIKISLDFYTDLSNKIFEHEHYFKNDLAIKFHNGDTDYLSTAFYLVSCAQEIGAKKMDKFGRFEYDFSLQKKFGLSEENLVQSCFDNLAMMPILENYSKKNVSKSRVFLSHDMDTVHGSLMQDGFFAIKKMRPDLIFSVFIKNLIERPLWLNIDQIMKIESESDFTSTFFWLVNKGKVDQSLSNSDYDINDTKVRSVIEKIGNSNWENGLHKSASPDSFNTEMGKLNCKVVGNRFHYLKFTLQDDFRRIEEAGLLFDSSLGFAGKYGFRNCYGQPYRPYNFEKRSAFKFVECPLNIMDTTFHNYLKLNADELVKATIDFCEKHKYGNVISVLFHNNYISEFKYKDYLSAFKKLLNYFYESDLKSISQSEIIKEYYYEY